MGTGIWVKCLPASSASRDSADSSITSNGQTQFLDSLSLFSESKWLIYILWSEVSNFYSISDRERERECVCGRAAHKFARCQLNGKGVKIRPKNTKTLGVYGLCRSSLRSSLMYKFICDKSSAECYMTCPFPHSTLKITKFYPRIDIANVSVISVALSQESKVHPETKDDVSFRDPKKGTSNNGQVIVMCFLQRS